MNRLAKPVFAAPRQASVGGGAAGMGGASGGAAGLGSFFSGVVSAARNLLNFTTYYQMKERAGIVGRDGRERGDHGRSARKRRTSRCT